MDTGNTKLGRKRGCPIDMTGQRFSSLTVVAATGERTKGRRLTWHCRCDCGQDFIAVGSDIRCGDTTSCGCRAIALSSQRGREQLTKHGMSCSPTWNSWNSMIHRCMSTYDIGYSNYGGRGISICVQWLGVHGFERFLVDMGERPAGTTLDRIEVNGNYEPANCRWASAKQQARNTRFNAITEPVAAEIKRLAERGAKPSEVAKQLGIAYATAYAVMHGRSWVD